MSVKYRTLYTDHFSKETVHHHDISIKLFGVQFY